MVVLGGKCYNSTDAQYMFCLVALQPSEAIRSLYSLCHRVLEPHPEFRSRRGRLEGLSPLHGPPVALRERDMQLSYRELGDDLAQRLRKKTEVGL